MNRIEDRFARLRETGRRGFIAYIGAGDPDPIATEELAVAFDEAGVDALELGVPFSDPLADGPVNQLAAQRGLASGTTPRKVLEIVANIRRRSQIPIVLYIYFNLLHHHGLERFIQDAARSGVDGLLILDLPPEEAGPCEAEMARAGLSMIFLVAPTTPEERMKLIAQHGSGFIYYVSREGVTGMQQTLADSIAQKTALIRKHTSLPIAVGFGISNAEQAAEVAAMSDAIVVGSAIVDRIARHGSEPDLPGRICDFVRPMVEAVKKTAAHSAPPLAARSQHEPFSASAPLPANATGSERSR